MKKNILESELVLNEDGSIYHLHLLPEDISDTILLVGDQNRVAEISKYFDKVEIVKSKREFITHTGLIGKKRFTVISTGIGTDNIDIVLNELDALANIDLKTRNIKDHFSKLQFIRIGTSGSLQKDIPVDSMVASSHGLGLDSLMNFYSINYSEHELELQKEMNKQLQLDFVNAYVVQSQGSLLNKFADLTNGITATCCGFYGPQGRMLRGEIKTPNLIERLNKINHNGIRVSNFEMETAAIYGLSKLFGHEALSINAIVANRITHEFSKDAQQTIDKTIRKVLETLTASN
ncbi:MAG: nucleoside phosphorylase [Bacteroidota bacterium]